MLEEACREAKSQRYAKAKRVAVITSRLLPMFLRFVADWLRPGGPRHEVANAMRLRLVLESLGPAFVKLGQAIAAREDILSEALAVELRKLCDAVAPFPRAHAQSLLVEELGAFAPTLQREAIASASLGQVYRVVVGGVEYAVKVQRPGLADQLAMDIVILKGLACLSRRAFARFCAHTVDLVRVVSAWSQTLWRELDYMREARTTEQMHRALCGHVSGLVVPRVCWHLTSAHVLTTEWVDGVKVTDCPQYVTRKHIYLGVELYATMLLDVGIVHADPHPGNMLILSDSSMCLLDFGMVIEIPPAHRKAWAACLVHMVRRDHIATLNSLIEIGFFPADCPRDIILPVMSKLWDEMVKCGSSTRKRKEVLWRNWKELMEMVRKFEFDLPDYYLALVRALLTLEGMAVAADTDFDIFQVVFPVALRAVTDVTTRSAGSIGKSLIRSCIGGFRSSSRKWIISVGFMSALLASVAAVRAM